MTEIVFNLDNTSSIPPFLGKQSSGIVDVCRVACVSKGLDFSLKESFSTSDANFYSCKGYEVISVSRGGENAHSKSETVKILDLKNALGVIKGIIEEGGDES